MLLLGLCNSIIMLFDHLKEHILYIHVRTCTIIIHVHVYHVHHVHVHYSQLKPRWCTIYPCRSSLPMEQWTLEGHSLAVSQRLVLSVVQSCKMPPVATLSWSASYHQALSFSSYSSWALSLDLYPTYVYCSPTQPTCIVASALTSRINMYMYMYIYRDIDFVWHCTHPLTPCIYFYRQR